jgi:hypothetical protein
MYQNDIQNNNKTTAKKNAGGNVCNNHADLMADYRIKIET